MHSFDDFELIGRVQEAKTDNLSKLPAHLFRPMRDDILAVFGLLESPIEQAFIFQLAGENFGTADAPLYLKVLPPGAEVSFFQHPLQLSPQVSFGQYRADFVISLYRQRLILECDGEAFHEDTERDERRDAYLLKNHGVSVYRVSGKSIWREQATSMIAEIVRAWGGA